MCNKPQDWLVHGIQLLCQLLLLLRPCFKPCDQAGNLVGTVPAPGLSFCSLHIQRSSAQQHIVIHCRDRYHDPWMLSIMHAAIVGDGVVSARRATIRPHQTVKTDGTSSRECTDAGTQAVQECHNKLPSDLRMYRLRLCACTEQQDGLHHIHVTSCASEWMLFSSITQHGQRNATCRGCIVI